MSLRGVPATKQSHFFERQPAINFESFIPEAVAQPSPVSSTVPELALAKSVSRQNETVAQNVARVETESMAPEQSEAGSDIDSIARDVYLILRKKLARERERSLGVS
jgi:hypothetical protein